MSVVCPKGCGSSWSSRCGAFLKRSEEHTSELQSQSNLVCRLLLEKKKNYKETVDVWDCPPESRHRRMMASGELAASIMHMTTVYFLPWNCLARAFSTVCAASRLP